VKAASLTPRLTDIVEAIERIRTEVEGVPLDAFEADWRKREGANCRCPTPGSDPVGSEPSGNDCQSALGRKHALAGLQIDAGAAGHT
jgi:hypothetical protein